MGRNAALKLARRKAPEILKLDLACGQHKREGFYGVDQVTTTATDAVADLLKFPWPWADESVAEVHCSHFFEHIPGKLRGRWMDELWRVLAPGAQATILVPYYASMRAVQDFTHEWPPVCEASFLYFNKQWRIENKLDHYPVTCDFDYGYGYALDPAWQTRHEEARSFALKQYLNVAMDLQVTLTKRG